jgi:hypothetical protein
MDGLQGEYKDGNKCRALGQKWLFTVRVSDYFRLNTQHFIINAAFRG